MRLNEAIDKALLGKILPFEQWKRIQNDPKARKRYEKEQEELRLQRKYSNMTTEGFNQIWRNGMSHSIKELFANTEIPEETLIQWAYFTSSTGTWKAELLLDYVGGGNMTKGSFGDRVVARMAKSIPSSIRAIAQSIKNQRSSYRRQNLSPEELERRDSEWKKQQQQRDEKKAEHERQEREELLREAIDRDLLDSIPVFDKWKEGGGSMRGYYKDQVKKKYNTRVTDAHGRDRFEAKHYKWALEQEPSGPGHLWEENQAEQLSKIMPAEGFRYNYHSLQDQYGQYRESYSYYKSGRHYTYEDQGY